jgi:hypothetical protein
MRHLTKIVVIAATAVILLMLMFPPYYGMKLPREENLHAFIGYHPIWNPPTATYAHQALHGHSHDAVEPQNAIEPRTDDERESLESYVVELNRVRLGFNIAIILLSTSAALLLGRRIKRIRHPA